MKTLAAALSAFTVAMAATPAKVTYSKDVAPILERSCQGCHRPGEVAPMSLLSYKEARPWAKSIRQAVLTKKMPPWFAAKGHNSFRNDPSLSQKDIDTLVAWCDAGAPEGNPSDLKKTAAFADGWNIGTPDAVIEMPIPFQVPAQGIIDIVYVVIPTGFTEDKWIQAAELRPGNRALVHHINAFTRAAGASSSLRNQKPGVPYFAPKYSGTPGPSATQPVSDALVGYVPGLQWKAWDPGQAKLIPAGADLILQLHYSTNGTAGEDRSKVGLVFSKEKPRERVVSAVAKSWDFVIPPGAPNHEVHSYVELAEDVNLVSLHPHMHYRGKDYEYKAIYPTGESEILLKVPHYDFNWQLTYFLEKPKLLPRGTRVECTAHYDNSANNPKNPDYTKTVTYGEQSWDEMMSGWIEVAFSTSKDPKSVFRLKPPVAPRPAAE